MLQAALNVLQNHSLVIYAQESLFKLEVPSGGDFLLRYMMEVQLCFGGTNIMLCKKWKEKVHFLCNVDSR